VPAIDYPKSFQPAIVFLRSRSSCALEWPPVAFAQFCGANSAIPGLRSNGFAVPQEPRGRAGNRARHERRVFDAAVGAADFEQARFTHHVQIISLVGRNGLMPPM
jgi:hypothetical protein